MDKEEMTLYVSLEYGCFKTICLV